MHVRKVSACNNTAFKIPSADSGYGQIVKCSIRDRTGRLWFGTTWKGAFCYDGVKFTHFTVKDGLISNQVNSLCEDASGLIWFGTNRGACFYDGKKFSHFPLSTAGKKPDYFSAQITSAVNGQSIENIVQDKAGNIWFGVWGSPGNAGAYKYDGKTLVHFFPESPVQGIVQDDKGGVWLNSKRYDGKSFTDFSGKENVFKDQVVKSLKDKNGHIWFGVREPGLYKFDGTRFSYYSKKEGLPDVRVSCIYEDKKGGLWVGSDIRFGTQKGGLFRYDGKSFSLFPQVYDLGMYSIWTAIEDKAGNIWFGGRGGKLCCYDGKRLIDFSDRLK